jgi:hypothetical protein
MTVLLFLTLSGKLKLEKSMYFLLPFFINGAHFLIFLNYIIIIINKEYSNNIFH